MTFNPQDFPLAGHCDCKLITFTLNTPPLIVHMCHCRWCQRESGSAFALNAMIETDHMTLLGPTPPIKVPVPSESGAGQDIYRCPRCQVAVWSNYDDPYDTLRLVRVGTLERQAACPPSIQIWTESKLPWLPLLEGVPAREQYYKAAEVWPRQSLERSEAMKERVRARERAKKGAGEEEGMGVEAASKA